MDAIEFVKKFGWEKAKEAITHVAWCETAYCIRLKHGCFKSASDCCVDINDLKQIVDAFELVEKAGGIDNAKGICSVEDTHYLGCKLPNCDDLKQAINLVEQCNA